MVWHKEPVVAIGPDGRIVLQRPAWEMLGQPAHVELGYDNERGTLGIKAGDSTGLPVAPTASKQGSVRINALRTLRLMGLDSVLDLCASSLDRRTRGERMRTVRIDRELLEVELPGRNGAAS